MNNNYLFKIIKVIIAIIIVLSFLLTIDNSSLQEEKKEFIDVENIISLNVLYSNQEKYIYFGRNDCILCKKLNSLIDKNDDKLPKKIYYFDTNYWRDSGITDMVCKKFQIVKVPCIVKIKNGKFIEEINLKNILNGKKGD